MRIWVIAGMLLAGSSGAALAQDAAAGEQVFRRLCSPCHDVGPEAKTKLGPPLTGLRAARPARSRASIIQSPTNPPASCGAQRASTNISARRCKKCRVPVWPSLASKMRRTSQIYGPISSNSDPTGRRSRQQRAQWLPAGGNALIHQARSRRLHPRCNAAEPA